MCTGARRTICRSVKPSALATFCEPLVALPDDSPRAGICFRAAINSIDAEKNEHVELSDGAESV
jgi:hypothetical protein